MLNFYQFSVAFTICLLYTWVVVALKMSTIYIDPSIFNTKKCKLKKKFKKELTKKSGFDILLVQPVENGWK